MGSETHDLLSVRRERDRETPPRVPLRRAALPGLVACATAFPIVVMCDHLYDNRPSQLESPNKRARSAGVPPQLAHRRKRLPSDCIIALSSVENHTKQ